MVDVPLRHRQPKQEHETASPHHGGWVRWIVAFFLLVAVVAALFALARVAIDAYRADLTLIGLTDDSEPLSIVVAGEPLSIPANMIRFAETRASAAADQVDLVLHWPSLTGYTEAYAEDFKDGSASAPLVYTTIAHRNTPLDATERLSNIYFRYFVDAPVPAPAGLIGRRLSQDSGYEGEIVYYVPDGTRPFVARCLAKATPETPATCLRDINFGRDLSLLYRFNRDLLDDWQALDDGMEKLAASFLIDKP